MEKGVVLKRIDKLQIASSIIILLSFIFVVFNMILFKKFMWQIIPLFVVIFLMFYGFIMKKKIKTNDISSESFSREVLQVLITSIFVLLIKFIVKFGNMAIKNVGVIRNVEFYVILCMVISCVLLLYAIVTQVIVSAVLMKNHRKTQIKEK